MVKNIFRYFEKRNSKEFRKRLKTLFTIWLFSIFAYVTFGGLTMTYAQGCEYMHEPMETYRNELNAKAVLTGEGNDSASANAVNLASNTNYWVGLMIGSDCQASVGERGDLPYAIRRGVLGIQEDSINALLYNAPTQNVYAHLAGEWVPNSYLSNTTVYAAESGYDHLLNSGIAGIWEAMRNLSYVLFIIVLIVAGFMIMFRHKIGGQAAVTVMSTIPNVIISLILVTFSFAIVGLIMNFGATLVTVIGGVLGLGDATILIEHPFSIWNNVWFGESGLADTMSVIGIGGIIAGMIGVIGSGVVILLGAGILLNIIIIALSGIIMVISFRVFLTLVKAYVGILIDTALAPIYLLIGAVPGQEDKRADWFRRVVKNVLVFPFVFFFVNLGLYLFENVSSISMPMNLLGSDDGSYSISGGLMDFILFVVVLYMFNLAAEVPKMLEDFLPQAGGKGFAEAAKVAGSKIPLIGGMFSS
jgi:hypothetical protein